MFYIPYKSIVYDMLCVTVGSETFLSSVIATLTSIQLASPSAR